MEKGGDGVVSGVRVVECQIHRLAQATGSVLPAQPSFRHASLTGLREAGPTGGTRAGST